MLPDDRRSQRLTHAHAHRGQARFMAVQIAGMWQIDVDMRIFVALGSDRHLPPFD